MQETWVWSLGQEDPMEEGRTTHSSTLVWRIPQTECHLAEHEAQGRKVSDMAEVTEYAHLKYV